MKRYATILSYPLLRSWKRFYGVAARSSLRTNALPSTSLPQQRRSFSLYKSSTIRCMPIKTVEVLSLPGPDFRDEKGNLIHTAKVMEIYIHEHHPVMAGDNVMVLQKKCNNNLNCELMFISAPVSGIMKKTHVRPFEPVFIGDKLFDIEYNPDDKIHIHHPEVSQTHKPWNYTRTDPVTTAPSTNTPSEDELPPPRKKRPPIVPLTKEQQREYQLVQMEVQAIQQEIDEINKTHTEARDSSYAMSSKIQLYERILTLKQEVYESVVRAAVAASTREEERLLRERINDPDPLDIADTLRTLGQLLVAAGNAQAALRHVKDAVIWRRRKNRMAGGGQHMDLVAEALIQLGMLRQKLSDAEGAKRDFFEALKLQTRLVGHTYHPTIAYTVHRLGDVHCELGMLEEGLRSYELALEIYRECASSTARTQHLENFGSSSFGQHPKETDEQKRNRYTLDTAEVLHNISAVLEQMGERRGALDHAKQELRIRRSLASATGQNDDLRIAMCHYVIAELQVASGGTQKKDPPLEHYEAAMKIYEAVHGRQHKTVAMVYMSMGALHMQLNQYHEALLSYKEGAELLLAIDGPDDPDVAAANMYVGQALFHKGKAFYDDSVKHLKFAYEILKRYDPAAPSDGKFPKIVAPDEEDDDSVEQYRLLLSTTIESISNVYKMQDRLDEARDFCLQAVQVSSSVVGDRHPDVASLYNNLGEIYAAQGNVVQSLENYEKARDIFTKLFGKNHPHTASVHFNIGLILRTDPDRIKEALLEVQKARDQWTKSLGAENVHVEKAEKLIAQLKQE